MRPIYKKENTKNSILFHPNTAFTAIKLLKVLKVEAF